MVTKTHFPFRIDVWDDQGNSIMQHVAGVDDFETAVATYWAAARRWPKAKITLNEQCPFIAANANPDNILDALVGHGRADI
jgi:hypothetical protein